VSLEKLFIHQVTFYIINNEGAINVLYTTFNTNFFLNKHYDTLHNLSNLGQIAFISS